MKILIPNSIELQLTSDADVVVYDAAAEIPSQHRDAEILVAWGNPTWQLEHTARNLTGLRLVQSLASGSDAVLAAGFDPQVTICSGRSLHDGPVAEHTLALILGAVRRLDRLHDAQHERRWDSEFVTTQAEPATRGQYTLGGARVTIWGFGSIAARLTPLLHLLGADVRGIARTAGIRSGVQVHAEDDAAEILADTDVLVSLLPATPETADLFDETVFEALKPGAVFVNVGRGATVDEDALIDALASGRLRTAAIDVMKTEPLATDSPLWATPNLVITPHAAGNRPLGGSTLIDENVARLAAGEELLNRVQP